ncbi:MAG: prepilin-type N-terminal cleavage/methylation domain-containing protein, partial [candidate division Zixibacteria bacterium]|nr:prepilin-type N-terminal cleavage/methylation domain-containing protein [candidate division Zixibacteria bacterium]
MKLSFYRMDEKRSGQGFTLLELAITMAIIGLLMVSGVGLYAALAKRQREVKTREEMEGIRQAILGYYENCLVLPSPDSGYLVPIEDLELSPNAQTDELYTGKYYAYVTTNDGSPFPDLKVDGQSIGSTAM